MTSPDVAVLQSVPMYRSAGKICALDLKALPLPEELARTYLEEAGCVFTEVDAAKIARTQVGLARFTLRPRFEDAPLKVNCSTFTKWVYAQKGIWLPKRAIQQRDMGEAVEMTDLKAGDLVFWTGTRNYYRTNPKDAVGHVGIYTGKGTMIHATNARRTNGVYETSLEELSLHRSFRGARRIIPTGTHPLTVTPPVEWDIESSDDFWWILLNIARRK